MLLYGMNGLFKLLCCLVSRITYWFGPFWPFFFFFCNPELCNNEKQSFSCEVHMLKMHNIYFLYSWYMACTMSRSTLLLPHLICIITAISCCDSWMLVHKCHLSPEIGPGSAVSSAICIQLADSSFYFYFFLIGQEMSWQCAIPSVQCMACHRISAAVWQLLQG